jgi:hypothetical protein
MSPLLQEVEEGETSFVIPAPSDEQALALFPDYFRIQFSYKQQTDVDNDVLIKLDPQTRQKLASLSFAITNLTVDEDSRCVLASHTGGKKFTMHDKWKEDVRSEIVKKGIDLLSWAVVRAGLKTTQIQEISKQVPGVHCDVHEDQLVLLLSSKNRESLRKAKALAEKEARNFDHWFGDYQTSSNIAVKPVHTYITGVSTDGVVSAVDEDLSCSGGVSREIWKHAGEEMRKEIRDHLAKHGQLAVTKVVATSGEPRWRRVIHAHGPRWKSDRDTPQCRQLLTDTVYNCLKKGADLGLTSLALPFVSSGE